MIVLIHIISRMQHLEYTESEIVGALADLEANAFETYIQAFADSLGFMPFSESQVRRLQESVSKWESALQFTKIRAS